MNELIMAAEHSFCDRKESLYRVGYYMNDLLLSAIAKEGDRGYARPKDAFKGLIAKDTK